MKRVRAASTLGDAMLPTPRMHTVRYSGVLAPASKWRPLVVPPPPANGSEDVADLFAAATATTTNAADDRAVAAHPAATRSPASATQGPLPRPLALADSAVATSSCGSPPDSSAASGRKPTHRCTWRPWAQLLARTFREELANCSCGGRMKLRALVTRPQSVRRILQHLGEPTDPPARAPARSPPFFQTGPLRRRLRSAAAQMSMFQG